MSHEASEFIYLYVVGTPLYSGLWVFIIAALIRLKRIQDPALRFWLWLVPLVAPVVGILTFNTFFLERCEWFHFIHFPFDERIHAVPLHQIWEQQDWLPLAFFVTVAFMAVTALARLATFGLGCAWPKRPEGRLTHQAECAALARRAGLEATVRLYAGDALATSGLRKPYILLPAPLAASLDNDELQAVLAHELGHIRRKDNWLNVLTFVFTYLNLFNPWSLLILRQLAREREKACDVWAVQVTQDPEALASGLFKAWDVRRAATRLPRWASSLMGTQTALEERLLNILAAPRASAPPSKGWVTVMAVLAFAGAFLIC